MSEWQPARIKIVHSRTPIWSVDPEKMKREIAKAESRIVYVRPSTPSPYVLKQHEMLNCDAKVFYEVRKDSVKDISNTGNTPMLCEHEVLTD